MAVYAADYADVRAGRAAEVARRVRTRLDRRKVLLCAGIVLWVCFEPAVELSLGWRNVSSLGIGWMLTRALFMGSIGYGIVRSHRAASAELQPLIDEGEPANELELGALPTQRANAG